MKRFIFASFLFLGWTFYVLSDGADFQPRRSDTPVASVVAAVPDDAAATVHVVTNPAPRKPKPYSAAALVAKPAIVQPKPAEPAPTSAQKASYDKAVAAAQLDQVRSSFGQGFTLSSPTDSADPSLTLASLEQEGVETGVSPAGTDATAGTPVPAILPEPPVDTREITGTRVNMRDGPGTIYPVIVRLTIGQEVEVLGESGTGWLRLRSMSNSQIGWVSASLVSKAAR